MYVDDAELAHFEPGSVVYLDAEAHRIRALHRVDRGHQVAFEGVTDRNQAEAIRNRDVFVAARRELRDDEFWPEDLIGLEVKPGGGRVAEVQFGPAQDRLVIERDGTRFDVPFVDELVPVVDVEAGYVEVVEIEGLSQPPGR